jgi:hypothetical protein
MSRRLFPEKIFRGKSEKRGGISFEEDKDSSQPRPKRLFFE